MYFSRYFFDRTLTIGATNILGLNINCTGRENSIFDCISDYTALTGETLTECPSYSTKPAAILCDQGAVQLGTNVRTRTRGLAYLTAR